MSNIKILVVEDESRIRHLLKLFFDKEGWKTDEAENGVEAMQKILETDYTLVILDLMMPKMDGWELCSKIKNYKDIPIIILTARGEESDRILGFELGADDYVVKPFSPVEIVLRIKALLKRTSQGSSINKEHIILYPNLQVDVQSHTVKINQADVQVTPLEFNLITFFAQHPGIVFSRDQLLTKIWGYDYIGETRTVDTNIKRLREKLASINPQVAAYIKTIWGVGYKFEVE